MKIPVKMRVFAIVVAALLALFASSAYAAPIMTTAAAAAEAAGPVTIDEAALDRLAKRSHEVLRAASQRSALMRGCPMGSDGKPLRSCRDTYAVDTTVLLSDSTLECLQGHGINNVVLQAYRSKGITNPLSMESVRNAKARGADMAAVYMFPNPLSASKTARMQVAEMYNMFKEYGVTPDLVWLDIEDIKFWSRSPSQNMAFAQEMLAAVMEHNIPVGVYTTIKNWQDIFGDLSYSPMGKLPLWYARYNYVPSQRDFVPFGGWEAPVIKQYLDNKNLCGELFDFNVIYND